MTGPRRLLLGGLMAILIVLIVKAHLGTIWPPNTGVDVEIPLRAVERWQSGGEPYLADAFSNIPGATQPFLYPPYVLPIFALLVDLPRDLVRVGAAVVLLLVAVVACRRLCIPWVWMPLVIAWPPIAEGILDGNVSVLIFAAYVFLFYQAGGAHWRPEPRDIVPPAEPAIVIGGLAAFIGAIKVSQPHIWLFVLRHRWRAAVVGASIVAVVALATLPMTGIDLWFDWIAQLQRAGNTTWDLGGFALPRFLPPGVGYLIAAGCVAAIWFVPRRDPAPWLGVLSVVGSLSLHIFGLMFLIPAMLKMRPEIVIAAAAFVATYAYVGSWAGAAIVLWCLLVLTFGRDKWTLNVARDPRVAPHP